MDEEDVAWLDIMNEKRSGMYDVLWPQKTWRNLSNQNVPLELLENKSNALITYVMSLKFMSYDLFLFYNFGLNILIWEISPRLLQT